ncbi:DUF4785 domain-containing protein [Teredinibacter purpureus]|uniref:DUF4785 domain-containing protein n=1 Tax=Teredinibacter purpureus TaxID=2731756 RepID=UPI0013C4D398|nr:DUF4785 domain-containing protein [Teredinibacter purpureus]
MTIKLNVIFNSILVTSLTVIVATFSSVSYSADIARESKTTYKAKILPLKASDLGSTTIESRLQTVEMPSINMNKETVTFVQVLGNGSAIESAIKPSYTSSSRSFKMHVKGNKLASGIIIPASSQSPIVRVVSQSNAKSFRADQLELKENGRWISGSKAFDIVADRNELNAAGMPSARDVFAMRLKSRGAATPIELRVNKLANLDGDFAIHVFETNSKTVLDLTVANTNLLQGDKLKADVKLHKGAAHLDIVSANGYLVSPRAATKIPVKINIIDGQVSSVIDTKGLSSNAAGLWELHITSEHKGGDVVVLRDAAVAFSLSAKTARFSGDVHIRKPLRKTEGLTLEFDIETALAGRYAVSAVIYGNDSNGNKKAGVMVSAAKWLDANGEIELDISPQKLAEADITAPFEVRYLELKDQTRMASLWSQTNALNIP